MTHISITLKHVYRKKSCTHWILNNYLQKTLDSHLKKKKKHVEPAAFLKSFGECELLKAAGFFFFGGSLNFN